MASFSQIIRFDAVKTKAFGAVTASYTAIGTPISHQVRIVKFTNTTDADMLISYDGATDNDVLPASSFVLYDLTSNAGVISKGTQLAVKYVAAPTKGSVYVTCIYAQGE